MSLVLRNWEPFNLLREFAFGAMNKVTDGHLSYTQGDKILLKCPFGCEVITLEVNTQSLDSKNWLRGNIFK